MPPLDHATLQAVLDKQGMPNTTENLNRIAQFAAVAPDMLEKYLGRGTDQSRVDAGGGTDAAIDRSIASTADPRLAQLAGPNPYSATLDPNTGLTNIGPGLVKGSAEPRGGGGGGAAKPPGIPGDYNAPVGAPPFPQRTATRGGVTSESEMNNPAINPAGVPTHAGDTGGGGSWTNFIAPSILALFAAQMARRGGGGTVAREAGAVTPPLSGAIPTPVQPPLPPVPTRGPTSPVPQPGAVPTPAPAPAPTPPPAAAASARPPMAPGPGQTPADVARLQAEVDAENAAQLKGQMKTRARSGGGGGRTTTAP